MLKNIILFLFLFFSFSSCDSSEKKQKITVAIAANTQFVMKEIAADFFKKTGFEVDLVSASSGKLTAQIQQGAPYSIFVSADFKHSQLLYENGKSATAPKTYAFGSLGIWTMDKSILTTENLDFLTSSEIEKIAIANPKIAPYGEAAIQVLKYYQLLEKVKPKLIYGESIAQTTQYITSNVVSLGFTAKSLLFSGKDIPRGKWISLNPKSYQPIRQTAILLNYGEQKHPIISRQFYDFLFSEKAQILFEKYGYKIEK